MALLIQKKKVFSHLYFRQSLHVCAEIVTVGSKSDITIPHYFPRSN